MNYRKLNTKEQVDLISYVKNYLSVHEGVEIQIGCDSQNRSRNTVFAVVLALYTPGKGAHVLYNKFDESLIRETSSRLMKEVWYSIELAGLLMENGLPRAKYIDIDLNPDPKYKSNQALRDAVGWAEGLGFKVRHKGDSPMMTYAADHLVKR